MTSYRFSISVSTEDWLSFYEGAIQNIIVRTFHGLRLSIPAQNFLPFVTFSGVQGTFEITFNEQKRITKLIKI
jgi:hypothetical protein